MAAPPNEPSASADLAEPPVGGSSALERARRGRRRPWGPFALLLAVGVALLWLGWRAELGRLRCWTIGAGSSVVVAVLAMAANRFRSRRRAGRP